MEKYLIVGLGNPGPEYHETRHNAGWMVIDSFAAEQGVTFEDKRYGYVAETSVKGRKLILLKPTTYMNLSGNAVRYWLEKENIPNENLLVIVDDLALPLGKMRLRGNGSNGGHNGLGHIQQLIGQQYARLRMGIGSEFNKGQQVDLIKVSKLTGFSASSLTRTSRFFSLASTQHERLSRALFLQASKGQ